MPYIVSVNLDNGFITVSSPFNTAFVQKARNLAGRWNGSTWTFDHRDEQRVRQALMEIFGKDGDCNATCTARFAFPSGYQATSSSIRIHGREIAKATGFDSGARLGDQVVLVKGECTSGGSYDEWTTRLVPGTILLVRDFPIWLAKKWAGEPADHEFACSIEAEGGPMPNLADLEREQARLLDLLTQLDTAIVHMTN